MPRSPPEPFTYSTSDSVPVAGFSWRTFTDVLPPPKLVTSGAEPSRFDRASSAVTPFGIALVMGQMFLPWSSGAGRARRPVEQTDPVERHATA